jgi:ATP-dependent Clp protease ATP-binding subunit ClpC
MLGFAPDGNEVNAYEQMKTKVQQELKQHFRPEFLNRIDDVIVFHQLTEAEIIEIVDLMIASLEKRLQDKDMAIELTPAAKSLLAERGYDPTLGARPLRRTIQRELEDPLSEQLLLGELPEDALIVAELDEETDTVRFRTVLAPKAPDAPPVELAGGERESQANGESADE